MSHESQLWWDLKPLESISIPPFVQKVKGDADLFQVGSMIKRITLNSLTLKIIPCFAF